MHFFTCNKNNKILEPEPSKNTSNTNIIVPKIKKEIRDMNKELEEIEDAPMLSFEGQIIKAKVVSVYDGDTIKAIFPLKDKFYKWNCRLTGIDTPELRTRNTNEKKFGYEVRDILRDKILNKIVNLHCGDFDKYGRLLTEVFFIDNNNSVNNWLIENKYAFAYDGGTKQCWEEYLVNQEKEMKQMIKEINENNIETPVNTENMERDETNIETPVNTEIMERDETNIETPNKLFIDSPQLGYIEVENKESDNIDNIVDNIDNIVDISDIIRF